jgi:hypothetical protein
MDWEPTSTRGWYFCLTQRIRIPEGIDISRLQEEPAERAEKVRISQLLKPERGEFVNLKYTVWYYAGLSGYIKGSLTVNANYLIFNPALDDADNISKFTGSSNSTQWKDSSNSTLSSRQSTSRTQRT